MFCTDSLNERVIRATQVIQEIFTNHEFLKMIASHPSYDMATKSPEKIVGYLKKSLEKNCIEVCLYKPWYRWSSAYAMFTPSKPNKINLNSRKLRRYVDEYDNLASLVGSIAHEFVHVVDNHNPSNSFGHGNNNPYGKENTAPYRIGEMAQWFVLTNEQFYK